MAAAQEASLYVLSHFQVQPVLAARANEEETVTTSLDLGLSEVDVALDSAGVQLPDGSLLAWSAVNTIAENESACFLVEEGTVSKIQRFSEALNRAYKLYPTRAAPTMLVSGLPMHRIKGTDPWQDTQQKVKTIAPISGRVLDTATGLGYTAIMAARSAREVTTVELDPAVLEICRLNPWSQDLFTDPAITQRMGDAFDVVETLEDQAFRRVIHDPPTFSLAGHLYGEDFYRELYRVLKPRGRLFHYIGNLKSRSGAGVARGVRQRLAAAGFKRVVDRQQAFGVLAFR
jgi:predicted methyltransferase